MTQPSLIENAACGLFAGMSTGAVVAIPEYIKVAMQIQGDAFSWRTFMKPETIPNIAKAVPSFSCFFGIVCTVEFSVNREIEHRYGTVPGIIASAMSGGLVLAGADHIMMRQELKQPLSDIAGEFLSFKKFPRLFTGFTPMVGREALFVTTVMETGPYIGDQLDALYRKYLPTQAEKTSNETPRHLKFAGTMMSGLITTTLSQPCDSIARRLQVQLYEGKTPRLWPVLCDMSVRAMYRGFGPRFFLSSFGGAMAADMYHLAKKQVDRNFSP